MYPTPDLKLIDRIFPNLEPSLFTLLKNRLDSFYEGIEKNGLEMPPLVQTGDFIKVMLFSEYFAVTLSQNPIFYQTLVNSGDRSRSYSDHTYSDRLKKIMVLEPFDTVLVKETLLQFKLYESIRIAWRDLLRNLLQNC